ncbi:UNVERIFIED_ORG: hypothetical protein FHR35_002703 [Microbispora rosea subsp. rosea]
MKVRIIGLPAELLTRTLDVIEISEPLPCRGVSRNVRIYAVVRLP